MPTFSTLNVDGHSSPPPPTAAYIQRMKGDDEWVNDRLQFWRDRMRHVMAQCDDDL